MIKVLFLFFCSVCIIKFAHTQTVSDTIDFSAYESETIITDQYVSESFLFSGYDGSGNPVVYDYGVDVFGRVLHSDDWYNPIKLSFVDSVDADVVRLIKSLDFDNPINPEIDYITVDAYDSLDVLVAHHVSTSPEHVSLDFVSENVAYIVFDDSAYTAYVIDNIIVEFVKGNVSDTTVTDTTQTDTTVIDTTIIDTTVIDTTDFVLSQLEEQFRIFPNPSSGNIFINSAILFDAMEVTNEMGQIIYALKPNQQNISFSIGRAGIYFIALTSGNYVVTKKIVIM